MALLSVQTLSYTTGAVPTLSAASTSDTVNDCGDGTSHFLWYKNTNASGRVITIQPPGTTEYGQSFTALTFSLAATNGERMVPLHPDYIDNTTGLATIALDASAGVTVAYVRTP